MAPDYAEQFRNLNVDEAHKPPSVHKPCMLLAVIDLAERGALVENEVRYEDTLEVFTAYAKAIRPGTNMHAYLPFFYLKGEEIWLLHPQSGTDDKHLRPTHGFMLGRRASLVPEDLHDLLTTSPLARRQMRDVLIERWFPETRASVEAVMSSRRPSNEYESKLRNDNPETAIAPRPRGSERKKSFRRLVLEAYDYRCAATGWRIIVPGGEPLVDAAHLIPFRESHNDHPSNGIALTPTYHRALDRRLIAPSRDMKWWISKALDKRILDNQPFFDLEGQDVIFLGKRHHHPTPEALQWRIDRLLRV